MNDKYNNLYNECHKYSVALDEANIHKQNLQVTLNETEREVIEKNKTIEVLKQKNLTNKQPLYNELEMPRFSLKEIEAQLKLMDKLWLRLICDYLKLDSYELVKNIAWIVNKENVEQIIAYRDWALQRNESLIKFLEKHITEKQKFDRLNWKQL